MTDCVTQILILIMLVVLGIVLGLGISGNYTANIQDKICKQLYANTQTYLDCVHDENIYKHIARIKPIQE